MESIIESLEKIGLTRYEAKAYIGMTNIITGKAEEIANYINENGEKAYVIGEVVDSHEGVELW